MQLSRFEVDLGMLVGMPVLRRAIGYVDDGSILAVRADGRSGRVFGVVQGSARQPYVANVQVTLDAGGRPRDLAGVCTCPVQQDCKHAVALAVAAADQLGGAQWLPEPPQLTWRSAIERLLPGEDDSEELAPLAVQFDVDGPVGALEVTLRPVVPGANGGWRRSGASWPALAPSRVPSPAGRRRAVLGELAAMYGSHAGYHYGRPTDVSLAGFRTPRVWDVLADAAQAGVPFVAARGLDGVVLHPTPVTAGIDVRAAADGGLTARPELQIDGVPLPAAASLLGVHAHGAAWVDDARVLHLAALGPTLDGAFDVHHAAPLHVQADEAAEFLSLCAVNLRALAPLTSSDDSVALPEVGEPELVLTLAYEPGRLSVEWTWRVPTADGEIVAPYGAANGGLGPAPEQRRLAQAAATACASQPVLLDGGGLAARCVLSGLALRGFAEQVRPALDALPGLRIDVKGDDFDLRHAGAEPEIEFEADDGAQDWLDLSVIVRVDGELVPFGDLFRAIAAGEPLLFLPSGTWLELGSPQFAELADLIAESRLLHDPEPGVVRLDRFQAGLWDDLTRLGTVTGRAAAQWRSAMDALLSHAADHDDELPVPAGLQAQLRPYQAAGFRWLARLHAAGLGGVLADEMGLGKTLQCLALFCRVHERTVGEPPFLVVAPTSVVSNWVDEAARFAPGLRVAAVTATSRKRGSRLADAIADADVVVTSYALFRLDHDEYAAGEWSGLVLDEAQFVKNHRSQAFACAARVPARVKIAITGTPMENNLAELWAMFAIAAPGLFPDIRGFEQYFRSPIERSRDTERLDLLRRRVRPFLLRRTKAEVVADLPAKQEQVLELDLDPKHRRAYETLLARERRKVMGLLGDLDRNQFEILRSLTILRQASLDIELADPTRPGVPSTKLDEVSRMLGELAAGGHRVLVFSQFTRFLHKVRDRLDGAGIEHCYLDGTTRRRADVVREFKQGQAPVFLISLKAGGFGLNLTEADYCILLDPWWNGAAEAQAVDRAHRIGQDRPVTVYRLVARNTIEQKVMAVKERKAALVAGVMDGGEWAGGRLTADEIRDLLA